MYYFDSTATTKPLKEVLDAYNLVCDKYWANASSAYTLGLKSNSLYLEAKEQVLNTLNLTNKEVLFTSGATEANNLAIYGICDKYLKEPKRVITSKIEHPSVYNVFQKLEALGFDVIYLDVDSQGIIDINELKQAMNKDTVLVSIMWVNNIVGSIEPIEEVISVVKNYPRCHLHIDAVQGIGKLSPKFSLNDVDLLTLSFHKLEGLKGSGALIYNKSINMMPHIQGADQQLGIKPGTIPLALIVSGAKALKIAIAKSSQNEATVLELNNYLREQIKQVSNIIINSSQNASPYILNISLKGVNAETVMHYLEARDIYVSIGSACGSKTKKPEKTILAMTKDMSIATSSIRISLSYHNTKAEIDYLIEALKAFWKGK